MRNFSEANEKVCQDMRERERLEKDLLGERLALPRCPVCRFPLVVRVVAGRLCFPCRCKHR